jgi:predicted metal-dependent enzyme (double-stranded beta helix superfamily)
MASSIAAQRKSACRALMRQAHAIIGKEGDGPDALEKLRDRLIALAMQEELFPRADFPLPRNESCNHILDVEPDDGFGLYMAVAMPGKEAAPHAHGIWCINAGISGRERHSFWHRTDNGRRAGHAMVEEVRSVLVRPGTGMCMGNDEIHSSIVIGREPAVSLMLYGYALARFPSVTWYHPQFSSVRASPSRRAAG